MAKTEGEDEERDERRHGEEVEGEEATAVPVRADEAGEGGREEEVRSSPRMATGHRARRAHSSPCAEANQTLTSHRHLPWLELRLVYVCMSVSLSLWLCAPCAVRVLRAVLPVQLQRLQRCSLCCCSLLTLCGYY